MGAFFTNSISVSRITSLSMNGSLLKNNQQKKNIMVYCQGSSSCSSNGGAGNVKTTSSNNGLPASSSSIVTDHQRSSILPMPKTDHGTAAALNDSESFVLTPNGKIPSQVVSYNTPPAADISQFHDHEGIGIVSFLRGKRFLITGATGFLAKVLIEKILRTVPDVDKIFLLIKAKDKEAAVERLKNEIINAELFKCLEETYGESYKTFMLSKLIPVLGNVCESNLGIEPELADQIANEVDIIVNSAANTTFDERYDVALDINTRGPYRLMTLAKTCKKLQLFLQVSTAYVNGQRQGRVMEKPFCIGESIASESRKPTATAAGTLPMLDVEAEIKLAMESREEFQDNLVTQKMKDLGLERARTYGWQDTYVFTKAMGEMMIDKMRGEIPVAIIRPSVIESTYNEPFPGWMEGNRMMDPIVLYYGKGQLTGFLVDPQGVLDVVPADMVVNAILAAMAKHGRKDAKAAATAAAGINIYQIASSVVNPLVFQDLSKLLFEHFSSLPYMDSRGMPIRVPEMKLFSSMNDFSSHIWMEAVHRCGGSSSSSTTTATATATATASGISSTSDGNEDVISSSLHGKKKQLSKRSLEMVCKKSVEQAKYLANIYEPYTFYGGRFDNSNAQKLMEAMSDEERRSFGFDVGSINWRDYISNVHIPGLRRHVMKGRGIFG